MKRLGVLLVKPAQHKKKPMRTIQEMAAEFGVSRHALARAIGDDSNSPIPFKPTAIVTYYYPDELRKWWKNRNPLNKGSENEDKAP